MPTPGKGAPSWVASRAEPRLPQAAPVSSMAESMARWGEEHLPVFQGGGELLGPGDGGALPKAGEGFLHLGGKVPHPRQGAQVPRLLAHGLLEAPPLGARTLSSPPE